MSFNEADTVFRCGYRVYMVGAGNGEAEDYPGEGCKAMKEQFQCCYAVYNQNLVHGNIEAKTCQQLDYAYDMKMSPVSEMFMEGLSAACAEDITDLVGTLAEIKAAGEITYADPLPDSPAEDGSEATHHPADVAEATRVGAASVFGVLLFLLYAGMW